MDVGGVTTQNKFLREGGHKARHIIEVERCLDVNSVVWLYTIESETIVVTTLAS